MTLPPLLGYQERTIRGIRQAMRAKRRAIVAVLPTGGGKTRVALAATHGCAERGWRVLWAVHRIELADQVRDLLPPGVELCTVQDLAARLAAGRPVPEARLIVCDEAHHLAAERWAAVPRHYLAARSDAIVLGLTAYPARADGRGLAPMFDNLVVGAHYSELLRAGVIVPAHVHAPTPGNSLAMPVQAALDRYLPGMQAIVFSRTVAEAEALAREIPRSAVVHGKLQEKLRRERVAAFRAGVLLVLINVGVLTEGIDVAECKGVVVARPISSVSLWLQMCNRATRALPHERLWPIERRSKQHAIVVDLCGSIADPSRGLGLPTQDRTYSLDGADGISRRPSTEPLWHCPACGWVAEARPADRLCESCGYVLPVPRAIRVRERRMERIEREAAWDGAAWEKERKALQDIARANGYKPGWVHARLRAKMERAEAARRATEARSE